MGRKADGGRCVRRSVKWEGMTVNEAEVILAIGGGMGRVTLNRPGALNALTADMCLRISQGLLDWAGDPAVEAVLIDHAGPRGFCAGGDVRRVAESGAGDGAEARRFFAAEYRMNELMFRYPKPVVTVMDGVTMGGGVGLAMPARYRIATEHTLWAMPEGDIGLFADVGMGWFLPRLPGEVGTWLALTGARPRAGDLMALGIATHFVQSDRLDEMKDALNSAHPRERGDERMGKTIARFASDPGHASIVQLQPKIDRLFAHDTVEGIMDALEADGSDWALEQREVMARKCPTTLKAALRLLREGRARADFAEEMRTEYRLAVRMTRRQDFIAGVRAVLVDKTGAPAWSPATLEDVDAALVDELFAPEPEGGEWYPISSSGLDS